MKPGLHTGFRHDTTEQSEMTMLILEKQQTYVLKILYMYFSFLLHLNITRFSYLHTRACILLTILIYKYNSRKKLTGDWIHTFDATTIVTAFLFPRTGYIYSTPYVASSENTIWRYRACSFFFCNALILFFITLEQNNNNSAFSKCAKP